MSSYIDIEPCPYCNFKSPALITEWKEMPYCRSVNWAYVYCGECHARGNVENDIEWLDGEYKGAAIATWNHLSRVKAEAAMR